MEATLLSPAGSRCAMENKPLTIRQIQLQELTVNGLRFEVASLLFFLAVLGTSMICYQSDMVLVFLSSNTLKARSTLLTIVTKVPSWLRLNFEDREDPSIMFHSFFLCLLASVFTVKILEQYMMRNAPLTTRSSSSTTPREMRLLQWRFLAVFLLFRVAFWMSGPYFFAAYASKVGTQNTVQVIAQISLMGYGAIAILGPFMGRLSDIFGCKLGTILGASCYGLGNLSVISSGLQTLYAGRAVGGVGQSLLSISAESWFISETKQLNPSYAKYLGETFAWAYSMDSIVAVVAGQLAGAAASYRGPTCPYLISPSFLGLSIVVVLLFWSESTPKQLAKGGKQEGMDKKSRRSIRDALGLIFTTPRILALGVAQSCFESAMHIWVLFWAPTMSTTVQASFGGSATTCYGTVFSCFMVACMLGSTLFGLTTKKVRLERIGTIVYTIASLCLAFASYYLQCEKPTTTTTVLKLLASYLGFETVVGMYFPLIGTLRGSILPDTHRSILMTLFAVPLNVIIVTVYLSLDRLGYAGAMQVAAVLLGLGACGMGYLDYSSIRPHAPQIRSAKPILCN